MGAFWDALWLQSSRWYSLRIFGRHWRLALAAVLSLSVAIAATMIGFAAYNALLLRPPGVGDPGSLLFIHAHTAMEPFGALSFDEFTDYLTPTPGRFRDCRVPALHRQHKVPYRRHATRTGAVDVRLGQLLACWVCPLALASDLRAFSPTPAAISWSVTRSGRGLDPIRESSAHVRLNDQPVTIAGVAPATFGGMTLVWEPDVWISLQRHRRSSGAHPAS